MLLVDPYKGVCQFLLFNFLGKETGFSGKDLENDGCLESEEINRIRTFQVPVPFEGF